MTSRGSAAADRAPAIQPCHDRVLAAADYIGALLGGLSFPFLIVPALGQVRGALLVGAVNAIAGVAVVFAVFRCEVTRRVPPLRFLDRPTLAAASVFPPARGRAKVAVEPSTLLHPVVLEYAREEWRAYEQYGMPMSRVAAGTRWPPCRGHRRMRRLPCDRVRSRWHSYPTVAGEFVAFVASKRWFITSLVTALSGVVVVTLAGAAEADPTVADGGGWAHAGAMPGGQPSLTSTAMQPSVTVGATTYSVTGIDVSSHDHSHFPIDWAAVAASGVDFAYVKATEGTPPDPYVNPYFASDVQAAKANGLYVGAYAFGRPDLGDPAGQADVLIDRSGWTPDRKTLIPMLDLEGPYGSLTQRFDSCWNMTGAISSWIRAFVKRIQVRTGRPPLIYTSASWWNTCTRSDTSFGSYPLNIAAWTNNTQPTLPAGWSTFAFWQYAPGNPTIAGDYDKDVFNGDLNALATYAGGSTFTSVGPTRVLDTRTGVGTGAAAVVGPWSSIPLRVAGANGVPASGVTAVVLNVTVTEPKATGFLTVWPDGQPRPNASNLNFTSGRTIPNLVTVPSVNGWVDFFNGSPGTVHVIADLAGYYSTVAGSRYTPAGPTRVLDTRTGTGTAAAAVGPSSSIQLQVAGANGVPASGVTAVVLNVTVTEPKAIGFLTVWPDGQPRPNASNLNFTSGQTIPNLVTVRVVNGKVDFFNGSPGTVHVIADLAGYYSTAVAGSRYTPAGPTRVLDTRTGTGTAAAAVGPSSSIQLQVAGANGVPASGVTAVVLNVTVTEPKATGYLTVWPDGQPRPNASNLNFTSGQTIPNLVAVRVVNGKVDFFNGSPGTVHVVGDLAGYFYQ